MKKFTARVFLVATQALLVAAFACLIVSTVGKNWLEKESSSIYGSSLHFGLTSLCQSDICTPRQKVLSFENFEWPFMPFTGYDFDIILITIIVSIAFTAAALILSLWLYCAVNGRKRWRIICSCVALMALTGVVACLIGIGYFEGKVSDNRISPQYKHGWTSIVAWLGFGLLVIDTVLLIILTCVKPDDHSKKPHSVKSTASYVSSENETYASSRDNKGFDNRDDSNNHAYYVGKKPNKSSLKNSIPLHTYEKAKNYRPSTVNEPDYGSPRGSSNLVYESDYRSSNGEFDRQRRSNEIVYDPRNRSTRNSRRRRSIELAYDSNESGPEESHRRTYSSGYPNTSEHSTRRKTDSTVLSDSRRHTYSPEHHNNSGYEDDYNNARVTTTGYDPRRSLKSPYDTRARTPTNNRSGYNPSNRTPRSNRYPNIDSDGYQVR